MFCRNCGKQLGPEIRFCPACGTKASANVETSWNEGSASGAQDPAGNGELPRAAQSSEWVGGFRPTARLLRPRSPRMLGGVCAAFALRYSWNLNAVRIATAVVSLFYGIGVLVYLACWIIIPEERYALPAQSR